MWANQLPRAWTTCENQNCGSPGQGSGLDCSLRFIDSWDYQYHMGMLIACWLCLGRSSHSVCKRCRGKTLACTATFAYFLQDKRCKSDRFDDSCTCTNAKYLKLKGCPSFTCRESHAAHKNPTSPVQRDNGFGKLRSRVTIPSKETFAKYLLSSVFGFGDSFVFCKNSAFLKDLCLFELGRHNFYFLSRFLVKYFKYFKGCGVRI